MFWGGFGQFASECLLGGRVLVFLVSFAWLVVVVGCFVMVFEVLGCGG